jgi:hypothetical protein
VWFAPRSSLGLDAVSAREEAAGFDGPVAGLEPALDRLVVHRRSLPPGTFVFVCSDFLAAPRPEAWLRALGLRWDIVPVVVQDPVWEQSFPLVDGLVVPFSDPATGKLLRTRISRAEARRRREANEARLANLIADFRSVGLDYVLLGESTPRAVQAAFVDWAEIRIASLRGEWR